MYHRFTPFRYSIQNKETALLIRNKKIVDDYTREATSDERILLDETEREGQLTRSWILKITGNALGSNFIYFFNYFFIYFFYLLFLLFVFSFILFIINFLFCYFIFVIFIF